MQSNRYSNPFKEPVDPKGHPKYYEVVKEPMGMFQILSIKTFYIITVSSFDRFENNRAKSQLQWVFESGRVYRGRYKDIRELSVLQPWRSALLHHGQVRGQPGAVPRQADRVHQRPGVRHRQPVIHNVSQKIFSFEACYQYYYY